MVVAIVKDDVDQTTDEIDVENAVTEVGFGKFNIKVTILCGLIYMNTGFSISSVGFILPSAACDLQLSTIDKGRISATPILGMLAGSYFWACVADIYGRRVSLLFALFSYAIMEIASSLVTTFWLFLLLKFFSGWAINGQSVLVFAYLGEFQSSQFREKIMCWMELAWILGRTVAPIVAWVIIPLNVAFVTDYLLFRSWNLFIIICALPSLLVGIWLLFFPETPKHLAESKQNEKLARVLELMYYQNTGGHFNEYLGNLNRRGYDRLHHRLTIAMEKRGKIVDEKKVNNSEHRVALKESKSRQGWKMMCRLCKQTLSLFKPPHVRNTAISCGLMYCVASSYYALMVWFPEVFQRFAEFETNQPGQSASVCGISSSSNQTMMLSSNDTAQRHVKEPNKCPNTVHTDVYLHTLVLGLSCLPVCLILPFGVKKLGYKFYLAFSSISASFVTGGFFFVKSSTQNLILSCIFESFTSVCLTCTMCLIVELFPTNLRVMAAALCTIFARLGGLVGNTLFGYLIDNYCIPLLGIIAGQLFLAALMSLSVSGRSRKEETK